MFLIFKGMGGWHFSWGLRGMRLLRKNKGYNGLNILGLAIGIACAGLIFLWVEDEMTFDSVHAKRERLYQLETTMTTDRNTFTMGSTLRPMAAAMVAEIPGVVRAARWSDEDRRVLFEYGGKSLYAAGRYCDPAAFGMFNFTFTEGDPAHPFPQYYSLIVTQSEAKKLFGTDRGVLNKVIKLDNKQDYVVTGVVKDPPENSSLQFEYLAPYEIEDRKNWNGSKGTLWAGYGPLTFVELDPHANLAAINDQLKGYIHRKNPDDKTESFLYPMKRLRLYGEFANGKETGTGRIREVRTLSVIAWIILLIACINFMNLATATAQKRAKEVGVRKVLGVGKRSLVLKFMGEALLMSAPAALVGVFLILLALPAFNGLMGKHLQLRLTDPAQLISLVAIVLVCGVVAGSYPAFYLSSFNPIAVLKGLKMKTGGAPLVRKGLVVLQFAVSVVFIVSTLVVFLQIQHIRNRDLGFNKDKLIEVNPERKIERTFPLIRNELMQTGLVENVALADHVTLYGGDTDDRFKWQGKAEGQGVNIAHRNVTPEYVSTSGMKVIAGRDFRENDEADASNVIINESMARLMAGGAGGAGDAASAVGRVIQSPRTEDGSYANMTVIGVIRNYIYGDVHDGGAAPVILFRKAPEYGNVIYVRPKAQANLAQVVGAIETVMKKENSAYPPEYEFVDQEFNRMFANDTQTSEVSGVFAVLAVLISCLGLFGLATYTAEQRTKEIGIRKVLGASVAGVSGMLTKNFLALVGVACLIAFPVAWWVMHSWLQDFEYRISLRWWMFGAAGAAAVLIALVTVGSQAMKAALANPVISLRSE